MALTVAYNESLTYIIPAFAPIDFALSSSASGDVAKVDYKIVCKVYYEPSGVNTLISTQQVNAIPPTNKSIFSVQDVVKSYIISTYSILAGDTTNLQRIDLPSFRVTFQEYYDGALRGSVVNSAIFTVWYASPTYRQFATNEWRLYNAANYLFSDPLFYLLTGFKNKISVINAFSKKDPFLKIKSTQKIQIAFPLRANFFDFDVWLKTLDSSFTQVTLSKLDLGSLTQNQFALDIGVTELPIHSWDVAPSFVGVKYFAIGIYNATNLEMGSYTYLYEIDDCKTNYTPYEIHWLNRWGGYDSFIFDGVSKVTTNANKTFAKYQPNRINSSGALVYNLYEQNKKPFHIGLNETHLVNSRLLEDFEIEGLQDLFTSPDVYLRTSDGFVSVTVNGTTFEHFKSENGKVFSVQLEINIDHSDERQW